MWTGLILAITRTSIWRGMGENSVPWRDTRDVPIIAYSTAVGKNVSGFATRIIDKSVRTYVTNVYGTQISKVEDCIG